MDLDDLIAQQEIRDVLARYTRGIDRLDHELVLSCYHPGAFDDHGEFQGTVEDFVDWVQHVLAYFDSTMHFLGQQLVEIDGERAHSETYCIAYHRRKARDGEEGSDLWMGLRYIDIFERRPVGGGSADRSRSSPKLARATDGDGEWRIAERRCAFDWTRRDTIIGEWMFSPEALRGRRDRDDPVYR